MSADILIYVAAFLGMLGILVTIHEFGHYLIARWSGVQVVKFCVGFGNSIWSYTDKRGTEFAIAAIPFGGFVRMLDDRDPDQAATLRPGQLPYMSLHPAWRIAIALGGPLANFILAFFVYWLLLVVGVLNVAPMIKTPAQNSPLAEAGVVGPAKLLAVDGVSATSWQNVGLALTERLGENGEIRVDLLDVHTAQPLTAMLPIAQWHKGVGEPDVLGSLGMVPTRLPVIGEVSPNSPAENAGIRPGDLLAAVDDVRVESWDELIEQVSPAAGQMLTIDVYRDGLKQKIQVRPEATENADGTTRGTLGVHLQSETIEVRTSMFEAIPQAASDTWDKTLMTLGIIKKMIVGDVSVKNLSGPISIAQFAGDSAKYSWRSFVGLLGLLSISLGVLNLLPIPILDGGQVIYNSAEWVMGRPVPERVQIIGVQVGLLMVGTLMVFATYNDILRVFG
ncbi:MAG: RIP metalloprotease RseP [Pseudomonadota bacterium]